MKIHYQAYKKELDEAVARVMESGYYILGPELEKFEKEFATWLGAKYTVGCASGTEAIYLALAACDVGPGDEVLVVAHTAVPTISAISMTGATPVFVDIKASLTSCVRASWNRRLRTRRKLLCRCISTVIWPRWRPS